MKVLLTGAAGFVGKHLLVRLAEENIPAVCLVRATSSWQVLQKIHPRAEFMVCDLTDAQAMASINVQADVIVHCAVVHDQRDPEEVYRQNVEAVQGLLALAHRNGIGTFLLLSSLEAVQESSDPYPRSKRAVEELVSESGLGHVIVRPSLIYGEVDHLRPLSKYLRQIHSLPIIPVIGNGRNQMQPVYVGDVVEIITRLLHGPWDGRTHHLCGRDPMSCNEVIDALAQFVDRRVVRLHVPLWVLMPLLALFERLRPDSRINRNKVRMFLRDQTCTSRDLFEALGYMPLGLKVGLQRWKKDHQAWQHTKRLDLF